MRRPVLPDRSHRGVSTILMTLMLTTIILPMVALGFDMSMLYLVRTRLQASVDGAALATARLLSNTANAESATEKARLGKIATQFLNANFPKGYWRTAAMPHMDVNQPPTFDKNGNAITDGFSVKQDSVSKRARVSIAASVTVPLMFGRIFQDTATVRSYGQAARRDIKLVIVLDRSSSMGSYITDLKTAVKDFIGDANAQGFRGAKVGGGDKLGLVVFGATGIVAYPERDPNVKGSVVDYSYTSSGKTYSGHYKNDGGHNGPDTGFDDETKGIKKLMDSLVQGSNTGMAEGLSLAWNELQRVQEPGVFNAIVLFTDGLPNGITAYWNQQGTDDLGLPKSVVKDPQGTTKVTCKYITDTSGTRAIIGAAAQGGNYKLGNGNTYGVLKPMMFTTGSSAAMLSKGDREDWVGHGSNTPSDPTYQCYFNTNGNPVNYKEDMTRFPEKDYWGNSTEPRTDPSTGVPYYKESGIYLHPDRCNGQNKPMNYNRTKLDDACHLGLASWNATDSAVRRIYDEGRTSGLFPVIYVIGFVNDHTAEKPDTALMQRMANVDGIMDADYPKGKYFETKDIAAAFAQVKSELLRFTQ